MIPCSPTSSAIPFSTKYIPSNVSQVRTRSTTKKLRHCLENYKGYHFRSLRNGDEGECNIAENQGMIDKLQEHVFKLNKFT